MLLWCLGDDVAYDLHPYVHLRSKKGKVCLDYPYYLEEEQEGQDISYDGYEYWPLPGTCTKNRKSEDIESWCTIDFCNERRCSLRWLGLLQRKVRRWGPWLWPTDTTSYVRLTAARFDKPTEMYGASGTPKIGRLHKKYKFSLGSTKFVLFIPAKVKGPTVGQRKLKKPKWMMVQTTTNTTDIFLYVVRSEDRRVTKERKDGPLPKRLIAQARPGHESYDNVLAQTNNR